MAGPFMASAHSNITAMLSSGREYFEQFLVPLEIRPVIEALSSVGLATFENALNRQELISLAKSLGSVHLHRDSDEEGITVLEPKKVIDKAGFTTNGLFPHTDASGTQCPPDVLIFCCEQKALFGGESLLVDGRQLISGLQVEDGALLALLTQPDSAMFSSVEGYVPMPVIAKGDLDRFAIRFRLDNSVLFPEQLRGKLPAFVDLIRKYTYRIPLNNGEGFIVNNGWWLHGRTAFRGFRRGARILIDVADRLPALRRGFTL